MKRLICVIFVCMLASCGPEDTGPNAVNSNFKEAIDQLMSVSFQSDSLGLIKSIDELKPFTEKEDLAFLAHYYIAFGKWQQALRQMVSNRGGEEVIKPLHEAIAELETVVSLKKDFADAYILSLNCHYPLYYLEPDRRQEIMTKTQTLRQKAMELDPQNPRLVKTDAQNIFYTPEQFGGSQQKGIERYQEAIQLFEEAPNTQNSLLPNWGHEIAYAWLGNAYLSLKQPNVRKAKAAFEKALELRPDFVWVKDIMLPQVTRQLEK